jgi:pectate lyase
VIVGAAFPGAQGSGAAATGGRGGAVIEVTTINDTGAGSLRAALAASGPRTIVFRMGGIICNKTDLRIGNPFVTVAGQTAPGGGITLGGVGQKGNCLFTNTHDVILRYLTYDGYDPNTPPGPATGTVGFAVGSGKCYNVVMDHLTARWWNNKVFLMLTNDAGPVTDVTVQFCLMYESNAAHPVGAMTDATSGPATSSTNLDYHHNLSVNIGHRLPLWNTKSGRWQNNLIYNWDYFAALFQGGCDVDVIGNAYIAGNLNVGDNDGHPHPLEMTKVQSTDDSSHSMPGPGSFYVVRNIGPQQKDPNGDQTILCAQTPGEGEAENGPVPPAWFRNAPLPAPKYAITDDTGNLDSVIVPTVGNSQMLNADGSFSLRRDTMDTRVVAQYSNRGPGQFFTGQFKAPSVDPGTPYPSKWHNGLSDVWVQNHGLDTADPNLNNKISPNAGITYLECFLSGVTP